tara:strand:+ start:1364 stop:1603 length:240 start_codon:yes stop_codon:yes gene_type:complete
MQDVYIGETKIGQAMSKMPDGNYLHFRPIEGMSLYSCEILIVDSESRVMMIDLGSIVMFKDGYDVYKAWITEEDVKNSS